MANQTHTVPTSAVVSDIEHQPTIWVVDDKEMSVNPRGIKVGNILGNQIEVIEGLSSGERIVVAGVSFLREGMSVALGLHTLNILEYASREIIIEFYE